jgi:peptidyl-dipeptidase Dcp
MTASRTNPITADWTGAHGLPPFSEIETGHFRPAFEQAIAEHATEIETIAGNWAAPDFTNTIEALERAGEGLRRASAVFFNLVGTDGNDELFEIERWAAPELASHRARIYQNKALFRRIDEIYQARDGLGLDAEQARVLERTHLRFRRAGAGLGEADGTRLADITRELAGLGTQFSQNVLADEAAFELPLESHDDLAGLPDYLIEAAAEAALTRKSKASHVITLSRSLIEPFLSFSSRRDMREQAYKAWTARGEHAGERDNRPLIKRTLELRRERAGLLGYDNFAAYKLDDSMAKTPAAVRELLQAVWQPARRRARDEADDLQNLIAADGGNFELAPWDWRYYAERLRAERFDLDDADIKPYLALDNLIAAAFDCATRLFGLSFKELTDAKAYHEEVRIWRVTDKAGREIGLFAGDYFARASKRSGAWMSGFRQQHKLDGGQRPIIVNVMNFAKPPAGQPALLTFDDARTLFHEFGHALHGLLSDVTYPQLAGTSVLRDFVELPSQLYEHWLMEPRVLKRFARHAETGDVMPDDLIAKIKRAELFNQGFAAVEYTASALADLELHQIDDLDEFDAGAFETEFGQKIGLPSAVALRHRLPHFGHVFSGDGYSAGYYAYMWSEVLDADAFKAFEEAGDIFDAETAQRLYAAIYSAGGKQDPAEAYKAFRGRLPSIDALLEKRGLAVA